MGQPRLDDPETSATLYIQEVRVGITLIGVTLPHFCVCPFFGDFQCRMLWYFYVQ